MTDRVVTVTSLIALVLALALTVVRARQESGTPIRCPVGMVELGSRCCAPGQSQINGRCAGEPTSCPVGLMPEEGTVPGCVAVPSRVRYSGGRLTLGPNDWEAQGLLTPRSIEVPPFELDSTEVTHAEWMPCAKGGVCRTQPESEPGTPVALVTPEEAAKFCRFVGGRLPRGDEWLFAAAGVAGRRYPWGQTGLVCRRAAFGMVRGPCASDGVGPEVGGLRPDGQSPEGALDLAGNVAEWTTEAGGEYVARGGSFRSRLARELKSWAVETLTGPRDDIGFRCAYDIAEPRAADATDEGG